MTAGQGGRGAGRRAPGGISHPRHDLDGLLTHAVRLSIVAALAGVGTAEFAAVRDSVEISDAMLSKQVALLEDAGYVRVEKRRVGRQARTWLGLSAAGTAAYHRHVAALRAIADPSPMPAPPDKNEAPGMIVGESGLADALGLRR